MSTLFLDIWTFAFSQIGLVAIGILLRDWLVSRIRSGIGDERRE